MLATGASKSRQSQSMNNNDYDEDNRHKDPREALRNGVRNVLRTAQHLV